MLPILTNFEFSFVAGQKREEIMKLTKNNFVSSNLFSFKKVQQRRVCSFIMEIGLSSNPLLNLQNTIAVIACEIQ